LLFKKYFAKLNLAMNLRFNERKATQAAARLLKLRGGRMSYMKLIKLLYLADRKALMQWGRPITTDRYVSMDHGPVLSRILNLTTDGNEPGGESVWSAAIAEPSHYDVELKSEPETDELSQAEINLLDAIFKEFGHKTRWQLVDLTHQLPEWKDPEGSAIPISYRDILKAESKTELEIVAIEDELSQLAEADLLLHSR
jgi:uncharacterized phage-associated protein